MLLTFVHRSILERSSSGRLISEKWSFYRCHNRHWSTRGPEKMWGALSTVVTLSPVLGMRASGKPTTPTFTLDTHFVYTENFRLSCENTPWK